jgi:hypothetical protein
MTPAHLVKSNDTLIPARDCLSMPLNMELPFAHSNVAAVDGACPVMGFTSHQQMHGGEPPGRVVGCSHFPRHHYGDRSAPRRRNTNWASGSTWFGWVFTGSKCWSEFLCLGGYLELLTSPRRAKWGGGVPAPPARGVRPADTPPPTPPAAGAPPAGPWQELAWQFALQRLA